MLLDRVYRVTFDTTIFGTDTVKKINMTSFRSNILPKIHRKSDCITGEKLLSYIRHTDEQLRHGLIHEYTLEKLESGANFADAMR